MVFRHMQSARVCASEGGDDTVGHPHRANILQFELLELSLLSKVYKRFSIEQCEPTASQSTVPFSPLSTVSSNSGSPTTSVRHYSADLSVSGGRATRYLKADYVKHMSYDVLHVGLSWSHMPRHVSRCLDLCLVVQR